MKNGYFLLLCFVILSSCASTEWVHMTVTEPAPVSLPPQAMRVGVINRSETDPKHKAIDVVDKIFSLEGARLDREGAAAGMESLIATLQLNGRFNAVIPISESYYKQSPAGVFPAALGWPEVERICAEHKVDLLFALEVFDTDSKVSYSVGMVSQNTPLGKVSLPEHTATMLTRLQTGWRIYDPVNRLVLDEYSLPRSLSFYGKGINPAAAAAALLERKQAVKQVGAQAGEVYAQRILPYKMRVTRDYFVRANDAFRIARRRAQTGNWDGAADIWQQQTDDASAKVAGRACYNMAIISEINGELDAAINWAGKAYEDYGVRLGLTYVRILEGRKISNQVLQDQAHK